MMGVHLFQPMPHILVYINFVIMNSQPSVSVMAQLVVLHGCTAVKWLLVQPYFFHRNVFKINVQCLHYCLTFYPLPRPITQGSTADSVKDYSSASIYRCALHHAIHV